MARAGADGDPVALLLDVRELGDAADVDEERRPGEAELHERQEGMTAGQDLGVLGLTEQPDRIVDRRRDLVVEGSRNHAPPP